MIKDRAEFDLRITQGATDLVNSILNYGYGILYSVIQKSLIKAGLYLNISFCHASAKFSLSFDMIEEFRSFIVDRVVVALASRRKVTSSKWAFSQRNKANSYEKNKLYPAFDALS